MIDRRQVFLGEGNFKWLCGSFRFVGVAPSPCFYLSLWHRPDPRDQQTRPNVHHSHDPKDLGVIITIVPSDQEIHYTAKIARSAGNARNET